MINRRLQLLAAAAGIAAGILALTGCVQPSPEPTPAPTPSPSPVATPAPSPTPTLTAAPLANWADAPATPGDWRYRATATQRLAEFRSPAGGQIVQLVCGANRNMLLAVIARVPSANAITVRTEFSDRVLRASTTENTVIAIIEPSDTLLDEMAFSKGRFAVEVAGGPQLFLPAWPEVVRVVEECRR